MLFFPKVERENRLVAIEPIGSGPEPVFREPAGRTAAKSSGEKPTFPKVLEALRKPPVGGVGKEGPS